MLSRLIRPPLQLRSILTLTLVSSSTKHSSHTSTTAPHLPPIGPNSSFPPRSSRSFSTPRGGGGGGDEGGGSWRFTTENDEADSIFIEEEGSLSGITEERAAAAAVESGTSSGSTPPGEDLWSDVDSKGDIFGAIDREVGAMKTADEEWETAEGYKPWSLGEDEDKKGIFSIGEEGGLGIEGIEGIEELETKGDEEKKQLEEKEKQLMTAMKGPNRAFGDLIAASGITEDMIDSLILLKDARGVKGLPPLHEIEDKAIARMNETSTRGEIERKKQEEIAKSRVRKVDEKGRAYGTGRRKCSIARVWIQPGDGKFIVNEKQFDAYFTLLDHRAALLKPFTETKTLGLWDVDCTVKGGGVSGQVGAVRLGISRALQNWEPGLRPYLKSAGYLTRDPRVVERKKPGKAKARKSFQWVKR